MTIQGYFDGTAVRPIEPLQIPLNQKVYIHIPSRQDEQRIEQQLKAIHQLNGLLSDNEAQKFDEVISQ